MNLRTPNREKYCENLSSQIAAYIEINADALRRNASLQKFGAYLTQCGQAK